LESDSVDLGDDMQRQATACPARFTFPDCRQLAVNSWKRMYFSTMRLHLFWTPRHLMAL
jgi:hypothetical protein